MKNSITLNSLIADLQKLAKDHGDDRVLSVNSCSGVFEGLSFLFSVRLASDVSSEENSYYVLSHN